MHNHIEEEYSRHAKVYDRRWAFYIEATVRETIGRLNLHPADRILDIGCGTGALLQPLSNIHPAEQLFGIDPVKEMLAIAQSKLSPSVTLLEGWAEHLPFADEQFNVVVCCSVFHYIRQPADVLEEIKRVLRPGGKLVITDWCDDYFIIKLCNTYLRLFNHAHFRAYDERTLVNMLKENGYSISSSDRYKINWMWGLMTICAEKITA